MFCSVLFCFFGWFFFLVVYKLKQNVISHVLLSCMVSSLIKKHINTMIKIFSLIFFSKQKIIAIETLGKSTDRGDGNFIMIKTYIVSDEFSMCRVSENRNKY